MQFLPVDLSDRFQALSDTWTNGLERFFLSLLPALSVSPAPASRLSLATSVFRCLNDQSVGHHYPTLRWYGDERLRWYRIPYRAHGDDVPLWPDEAWWVFDPRTSDVIQQIILACDADPDSMTLSELDELDPHVACLLCAESTMVKGSFHPPIKTWRTAVCAFSYYHDLASLTYAYPAHSLGQRTHGGT